MLITDIELGLFAAARYFAEEAGFEFTPPCAVIVRDFVRAGATAMRRQGRLEERDYDEAEANLGRFVGVMLEGAGSDFAARGPERTRFHQQVHPERRQVREGHFVAAKQLCPLWPYC